MNDIGTACGLAERTKVCVATTTVCEGHGSYSDIDYLTNLGRHQLQWIADRINDGCITVPDEPMQKDESDPDVYEQIRNCKTLEELIALDVHLSMQHEMRKAFRVNDGKFHRKYIKEDAERSLQVSCMTNKALEFIFNSNANQKGGD